MGRMKKDFPKSKINLPEDHPLHKINHGKKTIPPWVASNYSRPSLQVEEVGDISEFYFTTNVNLTIQLKLSEFTRKQACLISSQAIFLVLNEGMSISDWFILSFLYNYLIGSRENPEELESEISIELAQILKLLLLSGEFLTPTEKSRVPENIKRLCLLSKFIPNRRTFESRKQIYDLKKYLKIRIVPIDDLLERNHLSTPYSSYCKGYGESNSFAQRKGKTSFSSELDGEDEDSRRLERFPISLFARHSDLLLEETLLRIIKRDRNF